MQAQKAVWYRPAYGYAAAVVCVALAVCAAPGPSRAVTFRQAIDQTGWDAQLPLERLAVEARNPPAAPSQSQSPLQPAAQSSRPQPDQCVQATECDGPKQPHIGLAKLRTLRSEPGVRGYYMKIKDWKNWT
jgi:hypothetical protein